MVVACYGCVKVGRGVSEAANKQHLSGVGIGMGWGAKKERQKSSVPDQKWRLGVYKDEGRD